MKQTFLKSLALVVLMMCSMMSWAAIDWSSIGWVGASNNKFKVGAEDDANLPNVVNVQQPGWAAEQGIYMSFPAAGITCSHNCAVQGAGIVLYTSQFTTLETEVTVNYAGGSKTFVVYYADGVNAKLVKDYNYAQDGTATASSGNAALGCDGNAGTRWESASEDPQWWQLDLGEKCIFNTIQIVWEGAYAKTFTISVSDDAADWTVVKTITNVTLNAPWPNQQIYELDEDVTARYVRFDGIARGTVYGYSFWEFQVLYPNVSVLTSLSLSAEATMAKTGTQVNLTVGAKDQNNNSMEPGEIEWVVTPAGAGHVTDGKYVADQTGNATIKAKVGTIESPAVSVFAYAGDNLSLSTNIATDNKVIAQSTFAPNGTDAFYAVDANDGSVYQGSATNGTSDAEAERTFDSWFVLDLGAYYTIELITIKFEGACSQEYHIDFAETYSGESTVWTTAYNYVGHSGVNGHTAIWNDNVIDSQKVRFVRFFSTKAATQWGMKIFDMKVIGTAWVPSEDTEAPVMGTATVASIGWNKVVLNVTATDNEEVAAYHVVDATNSIDLTIPAAAQITVNGLTAATAYNFTITAKDLVGNESANSVVVAATTIAHYLAPQTAAPVPTHPAGKVIKAYSDAYAGPEYGSVHGAWGDATQYEAVEIDGDHIRLYHNLNWLGWANLAVDASEMEYLHIDIWASEDGQLGIVPIYGGDGLPTDDNKRKIVSLVGQQWNSFDLNLATDYAGLNLSSIFQFKFDNAQGDYFGIDNVYFYRTTSKQHVFTAVDADYHTLYLDFDATVPAGVTAYAGVQEDNYLTLSPIAGAIPANTGVVLLPAAAGDYTFTEADAATAVTSDLEGVLEATPYATLGDVLIMGTVDGHAAFCQPNTAIETALPANRAYLPNAALLANVFIRIEGEGGGEITTSVESLQAVELNWDMPVYNVLGQRVAKGATGVLLQNGVKYFVK